MTLLEKKVPGRNSFKSDGKIEIRTSQPASKEYILLQHIISKIIFCFSFFHCLPQRYLSDNNELFFVRINECINFQTFPIGAPKIR